MTRPRTAWLAGFVIGVAAGLLLLYMVGAALAVAFSVGALMTTHRAAAFGGLGIGLGAGLSAVVGVAAENCRRYAETSGSECTGPDLSPWFDAAIAAVVVGLALTLAAVRTRQAP